MILRQLLNRVIANEVHATITNVSHGKQILIYQHTNDRRPHARMLFVFTRRLVNRHIGELDRLLQDQRSLGEASPCGAFIRATSCIVRVLAKICQQAINCELACYLPGSMPAHSVADDENSTIYVIPKVVFVAET